MHSVKVQLDNIKYKPSVAYIRHIQLTHLISDAILLNNSNPIAAISCLEVCILVIFRLFPTRDTSENEEIQPIREKEVEVNPYHPIRITICHLYRTLR